MKKIEKFQKLVEIIETLRSEKGCPWDRQQNKNSLKPFLIEEVYEIIEAVDEDIPEKIKEELGDMLMLILFYAQISKEKGEFNIYDVIDTVIDKMLSRHPHVFGKVTLKTAEEVLQQWDKYKKQEGKLKNSIFEGLPNALPALIKAMKVQQRASRVGFDWNKIEDIEKKLTEEIKELKIAITQKDKKQIEEEIGDILFSIVNISRFIGINPEDALRKSILKFINRFKYIEKKAKEKGKELSSLTLEEMDMWWEEAKSF